MRFIYRLFAAALVVCSSCNCGHHYRHLPPLAPGNKDHYITIETGQTTPAELIAFARLLKGTPYKYGSTNPYEGFDCSGFVTCVFNHFGIRVPRPSVDFTYVNHTVGIKQAKPGDLIVFTGGDSSIRIIGHIGIIVSNSRGKVTFIHATSRHNLGVMETPMTLYYRRRYLKTIRVFPQNDR